MTIDGGKPHNVGDKGQRYEVTFMDELCRRRVLGWSDTTEGANSMVAAVNDHPSWRAPQIKDRQAVSAGSLVAGGRYNWKGQAERLVYIGVARHPGDRRVWFEFALVDKPDECWCEVLESDLTMFEVMQ